MKYDNKFRFIDINSKKEKKDKIRDKSRRRLKYVTRGPKRAAISMNGIA